MKYIFTMNDNELWWGGTSVDGQKCPFNAKTNIERDFNINCSNQTMPMFLSSQGRCIWSDNPFKVKISNGKFEIIGDEVVCEKLGCTLKEAYVGAMNKYFPPSGEHIPNEFFKTAQYNTWMEFTYYQNQDDILNYARKIIENGFAPGIFIIDEGWQKEYGDWDFDPLKFSAPKKMVDKLHEMGFTVMLWVVPNVRPDGLNYVKNVTEGFNPKHYNDIFLRNTNGDVAVTKWWNGNSAALDFTKECDCEFLDTQLQKLMKDYDIDGFKFDGGTVNMYSSASCINQKPNSDFTAHERNIAWNDFGTKYKFHEYKDTFKGGGKRTVQRIRDKLHTWDGEGLADLIPCAILQGILGHPFVCPDMIGGGEWTIRAHKQKIDEELFVRMAQCSALFPMMQFSWAPWEAVSKENLEIVKAAAKLHIEFADRIIDLIDKTYETGEPILRNLEYNYPHKGYGEITDIFMLGTEILVAPVLKKSETEREIPLPEGKWEYVDGNVFDGGKTIKIPVTLKSVPYFIKK